MNQVMYQAIRQEAILQQTLEETKAHIYQSILDTGPEPGILLINDGSPICVVAKLSAVRNTGLATENHIPRAQANAVRRKLAGAKTVTELVARLGEMVDTGIARFNGTDICKLNNRTISVLRQYI